MPFFFLRITSDGIASSPDHGSDVPDRQAAWTELTEVCGDLVRDACRSLEPSSVWGIELLDESKKPIYRVRVFGEAVPVGRQGLRRINNE